MKKIFALMLVLVMVFALVSCGGSKNEKDIVGVWKLVDTETETEYGLGIEFTDDGKLRYGLTADVFEAIGGDDAEDVMDGLDLLMSIEYKIKSDTEMEITMKALLGLAKETETIAYELNGDTLKFDGVEYTRVK
ncbi:MAG: hypothetical protein IJA67_10030 [Oscillospiraceae bacterium]|nr:hypothetical protein [Oscillospiraceae bacterium]